jgi:hypothetical protein
MLDKIYDWFLYNLGFIEGEHFSDMLARQRIRWGKGWFWVVGFTFFVVIGLIGFYIYKLYDAVKSKKPLVWLSVSLFFLLAFLGFISWLYTHILNFVPAIWKRTN